MCSLYQSRSDKRTELRPILKSTQTSPSGRPRQAARFAKRENRSTDGWTSPTHAVLMIAYVIHVASIWDELADPSMTSTA
jgi:hypothetical protein